MKELNLFLDIDGVLNCRSSECSDSYCIDAVLLNNWFRFLTKAEALFKVKIILSSTWQHYPSHLAYLKKHGVVWSNVTGQRKLSSTRSQEILFYIKENNLKEKYCIIFDDMVRSYELQYSDVRLIATDYDYGFNKERYKAAVALLKEIHENT